jgi:N-acetylglucosaminyldiphosphoundecaprenol N-acetyl-beta-D-mannosaminyltransferase
MKESSLKRTNILGVGISAVDMGQALETIRGWIESKEPHYVCVCVVHTVMECQRDERLRQIVNSAGLATPDGMPLVWLSRLAGHKHVTRVYGPDLMLAFCQLAAQEGYTNYFYGGDLGTPELLADKFSQKFPGLKIVGGYSPPFRPLSKEEDDEVVRMINEANPDVVWVGLGTPKQDWWVAEHVGRLSASVLIAIGAAFDFHAGRVKQAPRWMQRSGLEWLYRLCQEPRRLWRRYLTYNPLFLISLLLQWTGLKKYEL